MWQITSMLGVYTSGAQVKELANILNYATAEDEAFLGHLSHEQKSDDVEAGGPVGSHHDWLPEERLDEVSPCQIRKRLPMMFLLGPICSWSSFASFLHALLTCFTPPPGAATCATRFLRAADCIQDR